MPESRSRTTRRLLAIALAAVAAILFPGSAGAAPGDLGVTMVKDINPTPGEGTVQHMVRVGDVVLFASDDGVNGEELWRSDGTAAGTTMVKDINPGTDEDPPDPDSSNPTRLTVVGGTVYFVANDGVTGQELWRTNGTTAGTTLVEDINPGADDDPPSPDSSDIDWITGVNGTVFLAATDGTNGGELWKSDGTEPGTQIMNGPAGINTTMGAGSNPSSLRTLGTTLFLAANDGSTGTELWKSEAPHASAVQVANINQTTSAASSSPSQLTEYNGTLFFGADDGSSGVELWKSNGGALGMGGTELVKDINQTPTSSESSSPGGFAVSGGTLFFRAFDGITGFPAELWKSNGTTAGTQLAADINPAMGNGSQPSFLTDVGGTLFFSASDNVAGFELWKSNGGSLGPGGTERIADIRPGLPNSDPGGFAGQFVDVAGTAFFDANDGVNGVELWMSNGGPLGAGTRMVANINPGTASSHPGHLANVNGTLFFRANDGTNGAELWKTFIEGAAPPTIGPPTAVPSIPTTPQKKKKKKCKRKKKGAGASKKCKKKK